MNPAAPSPLRNVFASKIHRATVTQADLHYEGSITIDETLMEAADLLEFEQVHVWNITRGTRLVTYTLLGKRDSGVVCLNGAAAHHHKVGDLIIIASFAQMDTSSARAHTPKVVMVDGQNRIKEIRAEIPGPRTPPSSAKIASSRETH